MAKLPARIVIDTRPQHIAQLTVKRKISHFTSSSAANILPSLKHDQLPMMKTRNLTMSYPLYTSLPSFSLLKLILVLDPLYKLAILFPAESDTPKLIWLKLHTRSELDEEESRDHYWENSTDHPMNHIEDPTAMPYTRNGQDLVIYVGEHCHWSRPNCTIPPHLEC